MSVTRVAFTAEQGPFTIELDFEDGLERGLSERQRDAFGHAAMRWLKIIRSGGPPARVGGETINGLRIRAIKAPLDTKGGLSANTEVDHHALRGPESGAAEHLPTKATITLDADDMQALETAEAKATEQAQSDAQQNAIRERGRRYLVDLIAHEIGHALGLSAYVWERKNLLDRNVVTDSPVFTGATARDAYVAALRNASPSISSDLFRHVVPLEVFGDDDAFLGHWRQAIFHSELMTFLLEQTPNLIGPVTVAALADLGYDVDSARAETRQIDFTGTGVPEEPVAPDFPVFRLRPEHRFINCRVTQPENAPVQVGGGG